MIFFNRTLAIATTLVASIFIAACDFAGLNHALDDFKRIIELEKIDTPVSIRFIDASSGALIAEPVELNFAGVHHLAVVDLHNDEIPNHRAVFRGGVASFGIARGVEPTHDRPVILRLRADVPGYEPQVQNVRIADTGRQSLVVRLIRKYDAHPPGSATTIQSGRANDSGSIIESFDLSTPPVSGIGGATLHVDAGTVLRSAAGTAGCMLS